MAVVRIRAVRILGCASAYGDGQLDEQCRHQHGSCLVRAANRHIDLQIIVYLLEL